MLTSPQTFEEESGQTETFEGAKLPSSSELHEKAVKIHGKIIEPKSEGEKVSQEIAQDIGSMFSTPGLPILKKILLPLLGQGVKQVIKGAGGSEQAQDIGKMGVMALSTIANLGNAPLVASQAMNTARNMIPRGVRFIARPTELALQRIRNSPWYSTGRTASKGPAMDEIHRIEQAIQRGTINAQEAMQLRIDINEARTQLGGFQLNKPINKKSALRYLDEVDNALLQSMQNYGQRVNPQWWNTYQRANEAFRVTQRSRSISDFVQKHAKPLQSDMAKTLFHMGGASAIVHFPATMGAVIPGLAIAKGVQIMNRMIRSPVLRNHYLDVLRHSAQGNAAMMQKSLEKFDKAAQVFEDYKSSSKDQKPNK
jgi:hypothetical protein